MSDVTNFIFTEIAPRLWTVISNNIFLSISVMLGLIAGVMKLGNAIKK